MKIDFVDKVIGGVCVALVVLGIPISIFREDIGFLMVMPTGLAFVVYTLVRFK